ncbi:phosphoribosyltransferase [Devosia sp. XGJD_8]|uniref:phosphoribosyltransferase n=1 Tax=Devosia sp. XGJD_8 TaxID=3391187 RepID=UPI003984ACA0
MPFHDRKDAGEQLARALQHYQADHPVIVALPRGGVPVAAGVARALKAPLELLIVRKLGLPQQPELAMGAIVGGAEPVTIRNEDVIAAARISEAGFAAVRDRELAEIDRRRQRYLAQRPFPPLAGHMVILIDDGIATGATIRVAIRALRAMHPRKIVVAVPVAAPDILLTLKGEADDVICLEQHEPFGAIGLYYADFRQVEDDAVLQALAAAPSARSTRP